MAGIPRSTEVQIDDPIHVALKRLVRPLSAVLSSFQPGRVAIGTLLIAALMAGGSLWDAVRGERVPAVGWSDSAGMEMTGRAGTLEAMLVDGTASEWRTPFGRSLDGRPRGTFAAASEATTMAFRRAVVGTLALSPGDVVAAAWSGMVGVPRTLWRFDPWFLFVYGSYALACISLAAGAISRMSMVAVATGARLPASDALVFAGRSCTRLLGASFIPLLALAGICLVLLVPAALLKVPLLNIVAGALHGVWVLMALIAVFVVVASMLVWPLLAPAIAAERDDAMEALTRCVSYLLVRPLHLAALALFGLLGISLGYLVIAGLVAGSMNLADGMLAIWSPAVAPVLTTTHSMLGPGAGEITAGASEQLSGTAAFAAGAIGLWQTLFGAIVAGWVVSAFASASMSAYLSVREIADAQDPEEMWREPTGERWRGRVDDGDAGAGGER